MEQFRRPMIVDCHLQRERDLHRQQRSTTGFGDRRPELSKVILTLAMLRYDRSMMAIAGDIGFLDFSPPLCDGHAVQRISGYGKGRKNKGLVDLRN